MNTLRNIVCDIYALSQPAAAAGSTNLQPPCNLIFIAVAGLLDTEGRGSAVLERPWACTCPTSTLGQSDIDWV